MVKLLTSILFLIITNVSLSQRTFFFGMNQPPTPGGPPTVSIFAFDTKENVTGNTVNNLTGVPAGSLLVLTTASGLNNSTSTVTSSPSLTWTQRAFGNGNGGSALIYTAEFTAGGSIDVTSNFLGLNSFYTASTLYAVTNQEAVLGGNSATGLGQGTATVNITTTRPNSLIFVCTSNWNGIDGGSNGDAIVFTSGAQKNYYTRSLASTGATTVHFTYNPSAATSYTVGFTSPTDGDNGSNTAVYEVRGQ